MDPNTTPSGQGGNVSGAIGTGFPVATPPNPSNTSSPNDTGDIILSSSSGSTSNKGKNKFLIIGGIVLGILLIGTLLVTTFINNNLDNGVVANLVSGNALKKSEFDEIFSDENIGKLTFLDSEMQSMYNGTESLIHFLNSSESENELKAALKTMQGVNNDLSTYDFIEGHADLKENFQNLKSAISTWLPVYEKTIPVYSELFTAFWAEDPEKALIKLNKSDNTHLRSAAEHLQAYYDASADLDKQMEQSNCYTEIEISETCENLYNTAEDNITTNLSNDFTKETFSYLADGVKEEAKAEDKTITHLLIELLTKIAGEDTAEGAAK